MNTPTAIPKPAPPTPSSNNETPVGTTPTSVLQPTTVPLAHTPVNPVASTPNTSVLPTANTTPSVTPISPPAPSIGSVPTPLPSTNSSIPPSSPKPLPQRPPTTLSALSSMSSAAVPPPASSPVPPAGGAGKPPTPSTPAPANPNGPVMAKPKKNWLKFLPFIIGGVFLLLVGIFFAMRMLGNRTNSVSNNTQNPGSGNQVATGTPKTIEYWGLWEPNEVLSDVLKDFESQNPGVTVRYTKQSHKDYRERLQTAIASGNGPDVFRFHASWTPMLKQELAAAPSSVISASEFQSTYYPVATEQLQTNGQIVGVPLMYEGLALYYNKEIFRTANVQPPRTWPELKTLASQLTVNSATGIERGGLAIGNSTNVEHFSDVIALLMLQNGADLMNPNTPEGRDALLFYTNFVKIDKVWNETLPSSTVAFARGDVAMMFAPSWRYHEIKALNPQLEVGVASLPKLQNTDVTWASFWAEGVNAKGKQTAESWALIKFLSSAETLKKLYSSASEVRSFGEIYPRVDMAQELSGNEYVAPYLADAKLAKGGQMSSFTHDNGANDLIIKYYQDGVTALLAGKPIDEVLVTIDQGVKQTARQYGMSTAQTAR